MHRRWSLLIALVLVVAAMGCSSTPTGSDGAKGAATIDDAGVAWHAIERGPKTARLTVLFLHGAAYTSSIWDQRGILDAVATHGERAVAVDLPGSGDTPTPPADDTPSASSVSDGTLLRGLIEKLGGPERVVVVSPSASGRYSLGYLAQYPMDRLAGFVAVAPVGISDFHRPADAAKVPALLVWGAKDTSIPFANAAVLQRQLPGSRIEQIPGAGHAAYDDAPKAFDALLLPFLASLPG
jgi:abhydrolase domain-containing protein 14